MDIIGKVANFLDTNVKTIVFMLVFCLMWTVSGIVVIISGETILGMAVAILVWPLAFAMAHGIKWVQ